MQGASVQVFTRHPASVGETYGQHFLSASSFALRMFWGGLACLLHGIFPFLFTTTGSAQIRLLYEKMVTHRHRRPDVQDLSDTARQSA